MKEANQARNSNSTDRIIIASEEDSDQLELYIPETPRMAKVPASVNELLLREELIRIVTMYINKFG